MFVEVGPLWLLNGVSSWDEVKDKWASFLKSYGCDPHNVCDPGFKLALQ